MILLNITHKDNNSGYPGQLDFLTNSSLLIINIINRKCILFCSFKGDNNNWKKAQCCLHLLKFSLRCKVCQGSTSHISPFILENKTKHFCSFYQSNMHAKYGVVFRKNLPVICIISKKKVAAEYHDIFNH